MYKHYYRDMAYFTLTTLKAHTHAQLYIRKQSIINVSNSKLTLTALEFDLHCRYRVKRTLLSFHSYHKHRNIMCIQLVNKLIIILSFTQMDHARMHENKHTFACQFLDTGKLALIH